MTNPADPWSRTDVLDRDLLQALVARLEARGRQPDFMRMLDQYLDAMGIDSAATVLDLGCGTGIAARAIARRRAFRGSITGLDLSPHLLAEAGRLATREGVSDRIEFRVSDGRGIVCDDESFDAVVVHTLLSHVDDPLAVLNEVARVLKPGGAAGFFDGDFASLTFGHPDPGAARAYEDAIIRAVVTQPRVMREMPRLLRAVHLELVAVFPHVLAEVGRADYWLSGIETFRRLLSVAGVMSEDEAAAWAGGLLADSRDGVFFGSSNFYAYVARRP